MKFLTGLMALVATVGLAGSAYGAEIVDMTITSFGFGMGHATAAQGGADDSSAEQINMSIVPGGFQGGAGWDVLTTPSGTAADPNAGIVGFQFSFFGPVASYTTADTYDDETAAQYGVYAAPSGDITGGVMTLNLDAWSAGWSGQQFNQGGNTGGTMVIDSLVDNGNMTFNYALHWTKLIGAGPFVGNTGNWDLAGVATVVPEPMSMALVGSSLLGLIGLRRRLMA